MRPLRGSTSRGFTVLEVLVSLAVFSLCVISLSRVEQYTATMALRTEQKARALLVAEDIYEEMQAVPFEADGEREPGDESVRPWRLGSFHAYSGLQESPIRDLLGVAVPWGQDLSLDVRIRRIRAPDISLGRVLPPGTIEDYAHAQICIADRQSGEELISLEFDRAR